MQTQNRKLYLDFLRVLACFLVIFNHQPGYAAYQSSTSMIDAYFNLFFTMITRINVPLFFMISGSLLLSRDISYQDLFFKRILRIIYALIIASAAIYIAKNLDNLAEINLSDYIKKLIRGEHSGEYWYLYSYLGFLCMLPFFRGFVQHYRHSDFIVLIALHFIFSTALPLLNYYLDAKNVSIIYFSNDFSVPLSTTKALFYPLVGYYVDRVFDIHTFSKKKAGILFLSSLVGIYIASFFTYHQGINAGYTQDFVQTFDYLIAISIFLFMKYLYETNNRFLTSHISMHVVPLISSLTFGIYLLEPILKRIVNYFNIALPIANPLLASFAWCILSMSVCGLVTYILKQVPLFKKLL